MERTLLMIKPDAYANAREILDFVRQNGFEIAERYDFTFSRALAATFYEEHQGQPFFEPLLAFQTSGPVCVAVLVAEDAVAKLRHLLGSTDPKMARGGTIRQKWGTAMPNNAAHASATPLAAEREIQLLFGVSLRPLALDPPPIPEPAAFDINRAIAEADDELDPPTSPIGRDRFRK